MKVVFKVGGGSSSSRHHDSAASAGDSWYNYPPIYTTRASSPPPLPTYTHIGKLGENEDLPIIALSDKNTIYGGKIAAGVELNRIGRKSDEGNADRKKGGERNVNFASSSSSHRSDTNEAVRQSDMTASEQRGRHEDDQYRQPHESLVKRLRERMAMEAALRNEAGRVSPPRHVVFDLSLLLLLPLMVWL